jgi:arsenate reductase
MAEFPKLIERPIVISDQKGVIGRPPENIALFLKNIKI